MRRRSLFQFLGINSLGLLFARNLTGNDYVPEKRNLHLNVPTPIQGDNHNKMPDSTLSKNDIELIECKRTPEELKAWNEIVQEVSNNLKITSGDKVFNPIESGCQRIEIGFAFTKAEHDNKFFPNRIEKLLNEAADLLDRGLTLRGQYDELAAKYFNQLIDLKKYIDLDRIHDQLIDSEDYNTDYEYSLLLLESEKKLAQIKLKERERADAVHDKHARSWGKVMYQRVRKAFVGGHAMEKATYDTVGANSDGHVKFNEQYVRVRNHMHDAEQLIATHELEMQGIFYDKEREIAKQKELSQNDRLSGQSIVTAWKEKERRINIKRMCISRNYLDLKARVTTDPTGVLNYIKRLESLRERFSLDFRDAIARLQVVEKGLETVYGEQSVSASFWDTNNPDFFDKSWIWARKKIEFLTKFKQNDQGIIWPISLRKSLGSENFQKGISNGIWKLRIDHEGTLGRMSFVRLRGISCFTKLAGTEDQNLGSNLLWQVKVTPPRIAQYIHNVAKTNVSQEYTKPIICGRVSERNSNFDTEILGTSSLINTSPFGEWEIRVLSNLNDEPNSHLKDIQIDLHLLFQSLD